MCLEHRCEPIRHQNIYVCQREPEEYLCFFDHRPVPIDESQLKELQEHVSVEMIQPADIDECMRRMQVVSAKMWEGWEYPLGKCGDSVALRQKWLAELNLVQTWEKVLIWTDMPEPKEDLKKAHEDYNDQVKNELAKVEDLTVAEQAKSIEGLIGRPASLIEEQLRAGERRWLDLCGYPLKEVASWCNEWSEEYREALEQIQMLLLCHLCLTEVPSNFLTKCTNLIDLRLDYNHLSALPDVLGTLKHLEWIDLGYNNFAYFPPSVAELTSCKKLIFNHNKSNIFPLNIELFPALEELHIHGAFDYLPERIFRLTTLKVLYIKPQFKGAKIEISDDLGQFTELREFTVYAPHNIPESIGNLKNLEVLELIGGDITELPDSICTLPKLRKLELFGNKKMVIPGWLEALKDTVEVVHRP